MTCGLRQAGIDVIAGIDFAEECKETYEFNNKGSRFICADIKSLEVEILEKQYGICKNDDKLIFVGCSPCQYYSIIHTKKDKSKASKDLLKEFMRFVSYYNPGFVLVENVPGLLSKEDSVYPEFRAFLDEKRYAVKDEIVDMSYYGVPQSRRRFSLVASRLGIDVCLPPKETRQKLLRDVIGIENGFPPISAGHIDQTDFMHTTTSLSEKNLARVRRVPHDGGSRLAWKDDPDLQLMCYVGKDNSFRDVYGRLRWDAPSATITTNFVNTSSGRFSHPEEDRGLSIREGASLQTFPRDYVFKAKTIRANARIIGNAVPPEYGRRLGELLYSLYKQKYGTV
jgi:DNA (cytosine-5)-methyltransferase 1